VEAAFNMQTAKVSKRFSSDQKFQSVFCCNSIASSFYESCRNGVHLALRGGQSHIFRFRLRSSSKIFESGSWSGSEVFSNLRIRLLFRLRKPSMQPKFSNVCN